MLFPGVDPFIEASGAWPGFHHALITQVRDAIHETLPDDYVARIRKRAVPVDDWSQGYINVERLPEHQLTTSIEILSPLDKVSPGWGEFVMKRRALVAQGVNIVEIDLLVAGQRLESPELLPKRDYYAFVSRADRRGEREVYGWSIREMPPRIPIPNEPAAKDIVIDLSSLFAMTYDRGRYARTLPYGKPLNLPLASDDLRWAEERAKALTT